MELTVGAKIGDYEIVDVLGTGGMGKVFKVRNALSDRVEAMKLLLPNLAENPELADRFMREIKVQASLEHPNIAQLHTALRVDNQLLMLMEFVDGVSLEQKLRKDGPLPVPQAVSAIMQVLSALEFAHQRGVIHRDVKPANIMLTPAGQVKLMDFGIAKGSNDKQLTMTGTTLGSLYYMSPEQIQGAQDLDARADLYSVGVTLYELVTGKRPFDGDSQYAVMAAHLDKEPIPPISIDPALPPMLNDIILLSVAKHPNARFQSAAAMRTALGNVLGAGAPAPVAAQSPVASAVSAPPAPPTQPRTAAMPAPPAPAPAYAAPPQPPPAFNMPPPPPPYTAPGAQPMAANFAQSVMPPPPPPPPMQRSSGGRGVWMAIGALVVIAIAGAAVYFAPWKALTASKTQSETPSAQQAQPTPTTQPAQQAQATPSPTPVPSAAPSDAPPSVQPSQTQPPMAQAMQAPPPSSPVPQTAPGNLALAPNSAPTRPVKSNKSLPSAPGAPSNPYPMTPEPSQPGVAPAPQPAPQPAQPAGPTRAEIQGMREHLAKLGVRANGIQGSLSSLERSQQSMGMNLSSKFTGPRDLMHSYLQGAQEAMQANDLAEAKDLSEKAERQIEILEKLLNR